MTTNRIPSWGRVTAAPHEVLVHLRRGEVIQAQQGGSCLRWPSDTVALIDTSVHRLQFTADQVTREKTGVQVTGLAVYRVVEPLIAYRMIDMDDPDALPEILRQMLLGATRRLVANLTLEACLTQRKDALASELMAEVAPVISGSGSGDESTDRGWGVALDTIEIQDVRVLSEEVFSRLQATWREELALQAIRAREEVHREQASLEAARKRQAEQTRRELMALEEARIDAERERESRQHAHEQRLKEEELASMLQRERRKHGHNMELHRERTEAEIEAERLSAEGQNARAVAKAKVEVEVAERTAEAERLLGEARAEVEKLRRAATEQITQGQLQEILLTETLPEVARATRDSFDKIVVTGATDLSILGAGVGQVVSTLQALGVALPGED